MAQLVDSEMAREMAKPQANFKASMDHQTQLLDKIEANEAALPDSEIVGALLKFPIADGQALYLVVKASPLQVSHLPFADAYSVHPALIRGLTKADVALQVKQNRAWKSMFASKATTGKSSAPA